MPATASGLYRPPLHLETPRREFERVLRSDPCAWCALRPSALKGTVEHVIPRGAGGDNTAWNIVGACSACNGARGTRSLLVFLLDRLAADPEGRMP